MKTTTVQSSPARQAGRRTLHLQIQGKLRRIDLTPAAQGDLWSITLDGRALEGNARVLQPGVLSLNLHGRTYRGLLEESSSGSTVTVNGQQFSFETYDPRSLAARRRKQSASSGDQTIKAPMPGRIVRVFVDADQEVAAHQPVVAIEAMKMQNELKASRAGKVKEVRVAAGQTVVAGEIVAVIS